MKIQLQSLRVLNCDPLRDVCIHFNTDGDSPVTVLAGANGSGKTTALELIVSLGEMLLPNAELPPSGQHSCARSMLNSISWWMERSSAFFMAGSRTLPISPTTVWVGWGRSGLSGSRNTVLCLMCQRVR